MPQRIELLTLIPETGNKEVQLLPAEYVPALLAHYLPKTRPPKKSLPEVELLSFHVSYEAALAAAICHLTGQTDLLEIACAEERSLAMTLLIFGSVLS